MAARRRGVQDEPWRRSDGRFGAMLLLTATPDDFLEQWSRPAAPGYAPKITTVSEASRRDVVAAMILFTRCAPNSSGRCDSVADFRVIRPDGSTYGERFGAILWREAPPGETALQLGEARLAFEIEPDDPLGVYKIYATVRDLVATDPLRWCRNSRWLPPRPSSPRPGRAAQGSRSNVFQPATPKSDRTTAHGAKQRGILRRWPEPRESSSLLLGYTRTLIASTSKAFFLATLRNTFLGN